MGAGVGWAGAGWVRLPGGHQDPWSPCEAGAGETREEEEGWDGGHGAGGILGGEDPAAFDHWSELQSELWRCGAPGPGGPRCAPPFPR